MTKHVRKPELHFFMIWDIKTQKFNWICGERTYPQSQNKEKIEEKNNDFDWHDKEGK